MEDKFIVIKCPKCGFEYLPCEIFYPDSFLGEATNIVRDEEGKIQFYSNESMNLKEEFTCDKCGCEFIVEANVKFKTSEKVDDFDDEVSIKIPKKQKVMLEE